MDYHPSMDYDYHLPLVERLQAIPAARTGKKLIIKLPKVATSENDSHGIFAMRNCWLSHSGGGKRLRVTFKPMRPMVSKMKATFQRLGEGKNCQWFSPSQLQHPTGWVVPMYFAHTTGFRGYATKPVQEKVIQPLELKARDQRKRFWVTWVALDLGCVSLV